MSTRRITRSTAKKAFTPDLEAFFGQRNQRRFNPQVNVNYTLPALETMATRQEADQIATIITSLFEEQFTVSLYPGGLGGIVFSLAESPRVAKIFVSEPNHNLRQLLSNNLTSYAMTDKVTITPNYQREESSVLFLDLIQDPKLDIVNILQENKFPVYAFRVVNNYTPFQQPGYVCTLEETGNPKTNLLVCTAQTKEGKREFLDVDETWLDGFINFIDKTLSRIITSKEERQNYLREDLLGFWVQAFTNKTIDLNFNYEVLEMFGDRLMKASFADYLIQRIPGIVEKELTELQNYYLTTVPQSNLARDLGFAPYIRVVGEVKAKVLEDVLEAFFGALFRVSEEVAGGRGYYNVFSMIVSLYKEEPLEKQLENVKAGRDKTVFIQSLAKLQLGQAIEDFYEQDNLVHFTVTLSNKAREFFQTHGITVPKVVGHGVGNSKKSAESNAYSEALSLLREKGVTPEWIKEQQSILTFDRPEYQPYLPAARARLQKEGFTQMTFSTPVSTTTKRECIVQLIGHRPDKTRQILATVEACNLKSGRLEALKQYASGK